MVDDVLNIPSRRSKKNALTGTTKENYWDPKFRALQYRAAPIIYKKQEGWSRLDFLFEDRFILH